jgi:hypothetical protein
MPRSAPHRVRLRTALTRTRDSEMHQTKYNNLWHVGVKAHVCAVPESGLVHTLLRRGGERGGFDNGARVAAR